MAIEHKHDVVRIEVEETQGHTFTRIVLRDGNSHTYGKMPDEFFVGKKKIEDECTKQKVQSL